MNLDEFKSEVEKLGILVDDNKLSLLEKYYELLLDWNQKMNLTAITDKESVYLKHFYDSLTVCKVIDLTKEDSFCDIGTGAGFPGLVIKIFFPHLKMTLIDSLNKRIKFLSVVCDELDLEDVTLVHGRAEDFARENRNSFDVVTARAVSSFNILLEYSMPIVKNGKYFIAMRGIDDSDGGCHALRVLNSKIVTKECFNLPCENSSRTVIKVKKNSDIDLKYPRKFSEIKKNPL
ncbi:MAG: 16S rRNA (guanine(527)-N(7))-methyltransferase RsmG [Bacilli bacterium]|nr:16S rRNA (guanine(527)-N(7))-methyltransferase RsmG [Bacilli bacterium]